MITPIQQHIEKLNLTAEKRKEKGTQERRAGAGSIITPIQQHIEKLNLTAERVQGR